MLTVRVDGVWLQSIGAWTGLVVTHSWPHGSEEVTWQMMPTIRHPALRAGALVEVFNGGLRTWRGRLNQPSALGQFAANGAWSEAGGVYAIDNSGEATNVPDTAIDAAIFRGAVTWTRSSSISSASWGTAGQPLTLLQLLDDWADGQAKRWYVDTDNVVRAASDPSSPSWHVPHAVAGRGLALAEDDYYSHLVGSYMDGAGTFSSIKVGDSAAATKWGYKEALVDLTPMGIISSGTATTELNNRLALTGARIGFAENLQLGYGEITTQGGTPVPLTMPKAGEMVRLMGVTDQTRVNQSPALDIVIGRSVYNEEDRTLTLTPVGKASRNLQELLTAGLT